MIQVIFFSIFVNGELDFARASSVSIQNAMDVAKLLAEEAFLFFELYLN